MLKLAHVVMIMVMWISFLLVNICLGNGQGLWSELEKQARSVQGRMCNDLQALRAAQQKFPQSSPVLWLTM